MLLPARSLLRSLVLHAGVVGAAAVCIGGSGLRAPRRIEASFAPSEAAADEHEVATPPEPSPAEDDRAELDLREVDAPDAVLAELEVAELLSASPEHPDPGPSSEPAPEGKLLTEYDPGAWLVRTKRAPRPELRPEPAPAVAPLPQRPLAPAARVLAPLSGANAPPEYPPLARRRGLEGSCTLEITVDEHGAASHVLVLASSGHSSLDDAAAVAVRRWRFENGPGRAEVVIRFELEGGRAPAAG